MSDSASDNYSTHNFLLAFSITPIIDINKCNSGNYVYEPCLTIFPNGRPICLNQEEMISHWSDYKSQHHKFRCPNHFLCSKSPFGRVIYVKFDTNIKYFGPILYRDKECLEIYKDRTSCEQMNNRILKGYEFIKCRMHGRKRTLFMMNMVGINIHLDAYYKVLMR